jgi:hypothetical protein
MNRFAPWLLSLAAAVGCAETSDAPADARADARDDAAGETVDAVDTGGCPAGRTHCPAGCVDLTTDPGNCGACGHLCVAGEVCNESACASTCTAGLVNCSGACVDVDTDEAHCGSCSRACAADETCTSGSCLCVPQCAGRSCGPDECGGSCAPGCGPGYTCTAAGACSCGGTVCGSSCCTAGQLCLGGTCCTPSCAGRSCGSDGCGGSCPPGCGPGYTCTTAGACTCPGPVCGSTCCGADQVCYGTGCCTTACGGRECGSDGCGGSCPPGCDAEHSCSVSGTCVRSVWVFEAEGPGMGHTVGRAEADGWSANTADDVRGHMLYGPYATDIPAGAHTATFRMMIDNNTADTLRVVNLDINDFARTTVLAQRAVNRPNFLSTFSYQDFDVSFTSAAASQLEFRVFWEDIAYIRVDRVTVR